jgi:alpha-tubulin suppressor-like RCC1 family protein
MTENLSGAGRVRTVLTVAIVLGFGLLSRPAAAQVELRDVTTIASGEFHSCAITSRGGVKCWGSNDFGQLGDGTTAQRLLSVDVPGLGARATAIAAGGTHSCALTTDGAVKCWGGNDYGQLGDNSTARRTSPVAVSGLQAGVVAISAGRFHTCALTSSGAAKCWGQAQHGQLGNGSYTSARTPVDVATLESGVSSIAAGAYHTCALTTAGAAKCWGNNSNGQVGNNRTSDFLNGIASDPARPVDVSGLGSGVAAITAGWTHTCAATTAGAVKCWGNNRYGQVGDTSSQRLVPVAVAGLDSGVAALSAGWNHTCALGTGGAVLCLGVNTEGEFGDGTFVDARAAPAQVSGLASGVSMIASGGYHGCALKAHGIVECWGWNLHGELGNGVSVQRLAPVNVVGLTGVRQIAVGDEHTCALTADGGVKCWGHNSSGQLGDGTSLQRVTPVDVSPLGSGVSAIAAGSAHTCALMNGGAVRCWGLNDHGQLGNNGGGFARVPDDVVGLGSGVARIAAGRYNTCAVMSSGAIKCWGDNGYGQLGGSYGPPQRTPVDVPGFSTGGIAVAFGDEHACAITVDGAVKCWGTNGVGQLGDGTFTNHLQPANVTGLSSGVVAIDAGNTHTCALTDVPATPTAPPAKDVWCWGFNGNGQLGDNSDVNRNVPVRVPHLTRGDAIAVGGERSCAQTIGAISCWGRNVFGEIGDGTTTERWTATPVNIPAGAAGIYAGSFHACAVAAASSSATGPKPAGRVFCWGDNTFGQIGDGTTYSRNVPASVMTSSLGPYPPNYTDLWWNPAEPGWGINVAHQGNLIFVTLYTYNTDDSPLWLFMSNGTLPDDPYSYTGAVPYAGTLYSSSGPPFASAWAPNVATAVGSMELFFDFDPDGSAKLNYSVNGTFVSKTITRFAFSAPTTCTWTDSDRSAATNYQDLWWNPAEPGWGVNIAHQGDTLFATLYTYDAAGHALWLSMSDGRLLSPRTYSGDLYRSVGPAFNASPWGPYQLSRVGNMTFTFADGNSGTLSYSVDGVQVSKPIRRFVFASSTPLCTS